MRILRGGNSGEGLRGGIIRNYAIIRLYNQLTNPPSPPHTLERRCRRIEETLTKISNTAANNVPINELRIEQPQAIANYIPNTFSKEKVILMLNEVGWDTETLVDKFNENPRRFLTQVNQMPTAEEIREEAELSRARAAKEKADAEEEKSTKQERAFLGSQTQTETPSETSEYECSICMDDFDVSSPSFTYLGATHKHAGFCKECLSAYLNSASASGLTIPCPQHGCQVVLTSEVVASHAPPSLMDKLTRIENDTFISAAKDTTYCPVDNCRCIVRRKTPPEYLMRWGPECLAYVPAVCNRDCDDAPTTCGGEENKDNRTWEGVYDEDYRKDSSSQPKLAHRFCWTCRGEPHWPVPCDMRSQWVEKLKDEGVYKEDEVRKGKQSETTLLICTNRSLPAHRRLRKAVTTRR